jgi:hypothetical protein
VGARRLHGKKAGHNRGKDESECFKARLANHK